MNNTDIFDSVLLAIANSNNSWLVKQLPSDYSTELSPAVALALEIDGLINPILGGATANQIALLSTIVENVTKGRLLTRTSPNDYKQIATNIVAMFNEFSSSLANFTSASNPVVTPQPNTNSSPIINQILANLISINDKRSIQFNQNTSPYNILAGGDVNGNAIVLHKNAPSILAQNGVILQVLLGVVPHGPQPAGFIISYQIGPGESLTISKSPVGSHTIQVDKIDNPGGIIRQNSVIALIDAVIDGEDKTYIVIEPPLPIINSVPPNNIIGYTLTLDRGLCQFFPINSRIQVLTDYVFDFVLDGQGATITGIASRLWSGAHGRNCKVTNWIINNSQGSPSQIGGFADNGGFRNTIENTSYFHVTDTFPDPTGGGFESNERSKLVHLFWPTMNYAFDGSYFSGIEDCYIQSVYFRTIQGHNCVGNYVRDCVLNNVICDAGLIESLSIIHNWFQSISAGDNAINLTAPTKYLKVTGHNRFDLWPHLSDLTQTNFAAMLVLQGVDQDSILLDTFDTSANLRTATVGIPSSMPIGIYSPNSTNHYELVINNWYSSDVTLIYAACNSIKITGNNWQVNYDLTSGPNFIAFVLSVTSFRLTLSNSKINCGPGTVINADSTLIVLTLINTQLIGGNKCINLVSGTVCVRLNNSSLNGIVDAGVQLSNGTITLDGTNNPQTYLFQDINSSDYALVSREIANTPLPLTWSIVNGVGITINPTIGDTSTIRINICPYGSRAGIL